MSKYNQQVPILRDLKKFCRLNELFENSQKCHANNFFRFWLNQDYTAEVDVYFSNLEIELAQIENSVWHDFMEKCLPQVNNFDPKYHWANLWNILNEVKGYIFLKNQGFEHIEFLQVEKYKTPDIKGWSQYGTVLLEVKNVNRSECDTFWTVFQEIRILNSSNSATNIIDSKLKQLYASASEQILEYCRYAGEANKKICFFVIDVDILHHLKLRSEIEKYICEMPTCDLIDIEYVFVDRLINCE